VLKNIPNLLLRHTSIDTVNAQIFLEASVIWVDFNIRGRILPIFLISDIAPSYYLKYILNY